MEIVFRNPFRPGAGQLPPYLAGRGKDIIEFTDLLDQQPILKNLIIQGLRGVGKTVLLETLKPFAIKRGWIWAGTDLSESASVSEQNFAIRLIADLTSLVSPFVISEEEKKQMGFFGQFEKREVRLSYDTLIGIYNSTPGLVSDKIKRVFDIVWEVTKTKTKGIILAYDEAQNLKDHAVDKQYPLSVLLEVVQYLQRKEIPYLLVLTGLPTLYPNLISARTYSERMFHVITLEKLDDDASREAILKPIADDKCPATFSDESVSEIIKYSGGYPYFIQFFCKEVFDSYILQKSIGIEDPAISLSEITRKLDVDFYSGRWNHLTDKQKDLLLVTAKLLTANEEFTVQEIAEKSKELNEPTFTPSYINQILRKLITSGFIYKNRHGKYTFAVPLLADYINRQQNE